ncbi:MAG: hypothetical protein QXX77_05565 [Candidatus Methanosuratincola sp.]|jgi:hypothetical protein
MRIGAKLLSAALLTLMLPSLVLAYQNEPQGFRNLPWGSSSRLLGDKIFYDKIRTPGGTITYYEREGDLMKMGGAKLLSVAYGYWLDNLSDVIVRTKGKENWEALREAAVARWGTPRQPDKGKELYFWDGNTTVIVLTYDEKTAIGTLHLRSVDMIRARAVYQKKGLGRIPEF